MITGQIPLPGNGMDALNSGLNTMFADLLNKRKMAAAEEHFKKELALKQAKEQRLGKQFQQDFGLRSAASGRNASLFPIRQQMLMQQLQHAKNSNDPMYEINQYKALENFIKGQAGAASQQGEQQMPVPTQEMGQGMDMYSPEGMQAAQQAEQPQSTNGAEGGGLDLNLLRQHPMLRGFAKKHLGIDPLAGESNVLHGAARDASDLEKLRTQVGEDSPVYQNAKAQYDATLDSKKDLRDLRARTKAGLKPGEKEFFDEKTGAPLGKEIPLTEKERESEQGNILFNELYPYVYKGASPFSGEGSINRMEQAAANYKTDPKARKIFDDLLLSDKMLAATTVNEASTLKAGKTNRTYNMLKESLEAQDIPKVIKKLIKQYQIPSSAQLNASMRYQKLLSDARKKAKKETPATQKLFYNPELQAKNESEEQKSNDNSNNDGSKIYNGIRYYPDGQGGWEHD